MQNHEIIILLKSLTKDELKKLSRFLSSPYFNTNDKVLKLYKDIVRFYPAFTGSKLSKESIYKRIYDNGVYNDSTMRNLLFRFEQLIKSFLQIENFSRNTFDKHNYLLNELNIRLLRDSFAKESKKLDIKFSAFVGTDYNYFYNKYLHEASKYNFFSLHEKRTKKNRITVELESLNRANIYLTIFFVTEIICNYLTTSVYNQMFKNSGKTGFIDSLVKSFDVKKILKLTGGKVEYDFILQIYADLLECFVQFDNNQSYYNYRNNVNKYAPKLSYDEISFHYSKLISYCIMRQNLNEKEEEFKSELFNIYNVFLQKKYYKNNKTQYLPQNLFRAILFLALNLKELSWCKNFLDKYNSEIAPGQRENMLNFGYCFYYFHIGQYEKSLDYSNRVKNEYFIFKQDINSLSLRINFMMYNPEEIYRIIHKYREALREDEFIRINIKKAHLNFIAYCKQLADLKEGSKRVDADLVKEKLSDSQNLLHKEWLLEEYNKFLRKK